MYILIINFETIIEKYLHVIMPVDYYLVSKYI